MNKFNQDRIYRITLDSIKDAIFIHDKHGKFVDVNDAACSSLGYTREELLAMTVFQVEEGVKKLDLSKLWKNNTNFPIHLSGNHIRKDGSTFEVEISLSILHFEGEPLFIAVAHNVHPYLQLERQLNEQISHEQALRSISTLINTIEARNLDDILTEVSRRIQTLLNPDYYALTLCCGSPHHPRYKFIYSQGKLVSNDRYHLIQKRCSELPWLISTIKPGTTIAINDYDEWPLAASAEKERCQTLKLKGLCCSPIYCNDEFNGSLSLGSTKANHWTESHINFLESCTSLISHALSRVAMTNQLIDSQHKLEQTIEKTIEAFSHAMEARDPYTAGHQYRVAVIAKAIAQALKLPDELVYEIYLGALIHDIGKISIPSEILTKPTSLTDIEFSFIKTHPEEGYKITEQINLPQAIINIIMQHHERLDGSGYPKGLKGDQISLEARIVSVADVIEAMSTHRPYRPRLKEELVLKELKDNAGKLYDEKIVNTYLKLLKQGFTLPKQN